MLTKAMRAADVQFVELLLNQLEAKLKLARPIGVEVLIEEAAGLQNVEAIAAASPRLEALIFGMGDYSASQQMNLRGWGSEGYPGDVFHYPRFRIAMAAARRPGWTRLMDRSPISATRKAIGGRRSGPTCWASWASGRSTRPRSPRPWTSSRPAPRRYASPGTCGGLHRALAEGVGSVSVNGVMVDAASISGSS